MRNSNPPDPFAVPPSEIVRSGVRISGVEESPTILTGVTTPFEGPQQFNVAGSEAHSAYSAAYLAQRKRDFRAGAQYPADYL